MTPTGGQSQPPRASVLTIATEGGPALARAVASVQAQSSRATEHLVIDATSSIRDSNPIAPMIVPEGVRIISAASPGSTAAMIQGLRAATGDVVSFLDPGEAYLPWAVEAASAAFASDPNVDAIYGDGVIADERTRRQRPNVVPPSRASSTASLRVRPAIFFRRSLLDRLGEPDHRVGLVGDVEGWLIGGGVRLQRIDEVLAVQTDDVLSQSVAYARRMLREAGGRQASGGIGSRLLGGAWDRLQLVLRRRVIWSRMLYAAAGIGRHSSWPRYFRDGHVQVDRLRFLLMFIPKVGSRFAWNAMESQAVASVMWPTAPVAES